MPEDKIVILYATETGTAQDSADYIASQCRRIHCKTSVLSVDEYSISDLIDETFIIFVVATTGTGVEPRSMTPMWKMLLRSDLPSDIFEDLDFAIFALGDTAYEKFCWAGRKLSRRMQALGANEVIVRGEGDEQHQLGIDGALEPWTVTLVNHLLKTVPPTDERAIMDDVPAARMSLADSSADIIPSLSEPEYLTATVRTNIRMTASDWFQDVRHFEFNFGHDLEYSPGDIAVIPPVAPSAQVEEFLTYMGWGNIADKCFSLVNNETGLSLPRHLPNSSTLRYIFTHYLDINAVPRRSFFHWMRRFTADELEKERLDELLAPDGTDELYDYCYRVKRTICEVLSEFRQVRIPMDYIFDVFPPLRPRQFSIASAVEINPRQIQLCVAVVKYRTKLKVPRRGVATTYLAALQPGDTIRVRIMKGLLYLPVDVRTPVVCIGPGTGVAPMRAVIQQRAATAPHNASPHLATPLTLYFGCRSANKDQHYKDDWLTYAEKGVLTYRVACSRDGPEGHKRTYVQDLITEDANHIWNLMGTHNATFLISGSSNQMPAAVRLALRSAAETEGGLDETSALEYVQRLEREGRLIEECWS